MPISEVSICNQALSWLAGAQITSLNDDSREANLCLANYSNLRDAVMETTSWTFALARDILTPETDTPAFGYNYQFTIPADCLRLLSVRQGVDESDKVPWEREGNLILCDVESVYIQYIKRVTDPVQFSMAFTQALSARIAMEISVPLTESRQMQSDMAGLYDKKLSEAQNLDSQQGRAQKIRSSGLRDVRSVTHSRQSIR